MYFSQEKFTRQSLDFGADIWKKYQKIEICSFSSVASLFNYPTILNGSVIFVPGKL